MLKKNEFGEGALFTITNYIWWFLLGNIYFALTNILFIVVLIGTSSEGASSFNLITLISLLPAGPALVALFSVMGKLVREKDVDITKDFFKAYRQNFFEALFYWTIFLVILSIIYMDVIYFNVNVQFIPIKAIFIILAFILISMILYILPIISRFYFKRIDVLKISFYYTLKKIHITILNWVCLAGLSYILIKTSSPILLFFFWSIICFLIMYNEKSILAEIEEKCLST